MTSGRPPHTSSFRVVKHNDLQPTPRSRHLLTQQGEDLPPRDHIFISPSHGIGTAIPGGSRGKVDLTGLIVNQETRNRMMRKVQKVDLKGERQCNMVGQPVGAATDFPKVVVARARITLTVRSGIMSRTGASGHSASRRGIRRAVVASMLSIALRSFRPISVSETLPCNSAICVLSSSISCRRLAD